MPKYIGEKVCFYEWPQGMEIVSCKVNEDGTRDHILIVSPNDAQAIIESLDKFIEVTYDNGTD